MGGGVQGRTHDGKEGWECAHIPTIASEFNRPAGRSRHAQSVSHTGYGGPPARPRVRTRELNTSKQNAAVIDVATSMTAQTRSADLPARRPRQAHLSGHCIATVCARPGTRRRSCTGRRTDVALVHLCNFLALFLESRKPAAAAAAPRSTFPLRLVLPARESAEEVHPPAGMESGRDLCPGRPQTWGGDLQPERSQNRGRLNDPFLLLAGKRACRTCASAVLRARYVVSGLCLLHGAALLEVTVAAKRLIGSPFTCQRRRL